MLTLTLGSFALALNHLILLLALALATLIGWRVARRGGADNPESALFSLFLLGLLAARAGFVIRYWPHFRNDLTQIIDIRDGGFLFWPGILALLIGAATWGWRRPPLRRPLGWGLGSGVLFWGLLTLSTHLYEQGMRLPQLALRTLTGEAVQLEQYRGRPLVINLWATWCPPCRREMPVLQQAQRERPDITFLFVNQAESPQNVTTFLATQGLTLSNVLFDSGGLLGQKVGSMALPTTLFYNADGRMLGNHLGELSNASLAKALENFEPSSTTAPHPGATTGKPL